MACRAPRITYSPDAGPNDRLVALLHRLSIASTELLAATPPDPADRAAAHRLDAYWAARTQFIVAGLLVRPTASTQVLLAQVRNLLKRIAGSLARSDPPTARALLADLVQAQPARPEVGLALRQLGTATH